MYQCRAVEVHDSCYSLDIARGHRRRAGEHRCGPSMPPGTQSSSLAESQTVYQLENVTLPHIFNVGMLLCLFKKDACIVV